jgi:flagellar hook-associated protein 1 FlgK
MSRGYFISDYTDVPIAPEKPLAENYESDGEYQDAMAQYQEDLNQYTKDLDYFDTYVEPYTITNLMAQLDVLVNAMVTGINDALCPNKEVTLADGSTIKILDEDAAGIGMGDGNEFAGTELFTRNGTPRYTEQTITLEDGSTINAKVYNEENEDDYSTLYTTGSIQINQALLQNPSLLPLSRQSGEEAQEVADALLDLWNEKFATVSPNKLVGCNYKDYYAGMLEDLANRGYTYDSMVEAQQQAVNEWDNHRQTVVGVSSDEELSNMIRFQHAYNASSRYINTVSEMIEYLIEKLG